MSKQPIKHLARFIAAAVLLPMFTVPPAALSQDAAPADAASEEATAAAALADKQSRIADKYRRLEELLFKMEQLERGENPQRANLLREAIAHGRGEGIQLQLNALVKRLSEEDYRRAEDGQSQVKADLLALLELLQKEDRARRNASEQQRIKAYIKELDRLIRKESSIQGRTEGGADARDLAEEQGDVAERTGDLSNKIREHEEGKPAGDKQPPEDGDAKPQKGEPQEGEPAEPQSQEGQPQEGQPQEGQPQQGQPQESQPQDQAAQQQPNPARERIEQAQHQMKEAQQQLEKAEREGAVEKQEEARRLLEQAKAELEEILRQLREEEIERTLALLEARFRKMLKMQEKVYDDTVALDSLQSSGDDPTVPARSAKVSFEQKKIIVEVDQALALLKEEGSSVAFPEVIGQMREDMVEVTDRLAEVKLGKVTQGLEEDIIDTLKQMIEAFQQAQKDQEQRQSDMPPGEGQAEDPGLVDMIAELKMVRAMQDRVNNRTRRYADLLENPEDLVGQATEEELQRAIVELSEREKSCQRVTRDIVLGRNE